jgi:transposase InsO family protein
MIWSQKGDQLMPFEVKTNMDQRREFVLLARQDGANIRGLCRRYGISADTGYRLLKRYREGGDAALTDRSRRPRTSPRQTAPDLEAVVVALRTAHPTWGGRKLQARLRAQGVDPVPAPSTITGILRRHDLLDPALTSPRAWQRYERDAPNELWQIDFKGHHRMLKGRVHPLSVLDDHSRFALGLFACAHERGTLVQQHLITCFERYGLPWTILADNGGPWGASHPGAITWLEAWFIRLGIQVVHGRPYHPQTQGKVERWHRTIKTDVFQFNTFRDLATTQVALDRFRQEYNTERPHEALEMAVPASRYQPSPRPYPAVLPEIVYSDECIVCQVHRAGWIWFGGRQHFVSEALRGLPVGVRPTTVDGVFVVRFCDRAIKRLDHRQRP